MGMPNPVRDNNECTCRGGREDTCDHDHDVVQKLAERGGKGCYLYDTSKYELSWRVNVTMKGITKRQYSHHVARAVEISHAACKD